MAKDLEILSLGDKFVDLRDNLAGDAYNWAWIRPLSEVKYLAIHHSGNLDVKTAQDLAKFHIENNNWGGIGYHFVIDDLGVVYYVADLSTARANVANMNEQVIGICLMGNFDMAEPAKAQLDSTSKLCQFLIGDYANLPAIDGWDKVLGHCEFPNQSTTCPGKTWLNWKTKIVKGEDSEDMESLETIQPLETPIEDETQYLKDQVDNLQVSLASVNEQLIQTMETLSTREQEIAILKSKQSHNGEDLIDQTLTLTEIFYNLYKLVFLPRKME